MAAAALIAVTFTAALHAALPTFWQVSTEAEFLEGEVENLSIDSYGRLTLGPTMAPVFDATAPFLWSMVDGPDGSVFIGTGNEGQVLRVDAMGRSTVFFDAGELEVHALAPAPGGGLFAGTSPEGKVYRIDSTGQATTLFDPPDRYIWSLAVDRAGNVFAATGDKGIIYRITPDGTGTVFYDTKSTHAMTLAFDSQGRLLAGTESPGRVFQFDAAGRPFVLLDSPYNEIRTLRLGPDGTMYAAALNGRPGGAQPQQPASPPPAPAAPPAGGTPTVTTEVVGFAIAETVTVAASTPPQQSARSQGPNVGGVYRIFPDGASDVIWESADDLPYDLAFDGDGSLVLATGSEGKIYRLGGDPLQPTLIARVDARQITTMIRDRGGRVLFATSNPGRVIRLSPERAARGTYTSEVRDAQTVATWGTIKWSAATPAGTRVELSTRSGNTRTPDETWSPWSDTYGDATGSGITSPRARYLQWRAVLTGSGGQSPVMTSVTAAYLPRNLRPSVTSITINPPGTVFQRPFPTGDPGIAGFEGDTPDRRFAQLTGAVAPGSTPTLGRRDYQRGLLTFVWRAEDDNRDDLLYEVQYRREGDAAWKPLRDRLSDPIFVWDTTSVPNGRYVLRVIASDAPSNSPDTMLTGARETTAFDIDNTPPTIVVSNSRRDGARTVLTFTVRDEDSSVQKVEYSLDGTQWQTVYPRDGIADSRVEQFELRLEGEMAARGVIIRAADALNNVASERGDAPPPSGAR